MLCLPSYAKEYSNTVKLTAETEKSAAESLVFRVNNNSCFIKGMRCAVDESNPKIAPFAENGAVYVPLDICTETFGTKPETEVKIKYKTEFADAEAVAQKLGKKYYTDGKLAVISENETSAKSAKELSDALEYKWQNVWLGMEGFVTGMVAHPKDPDLIYARTDVGGAYRWNAKGQRWIPMTDCISHEDIWLNCVAGIAVDPSDVNTVYIACGAYTYTTPYDVLKSTDKGKTWKRTNLNKMQLGEGDHRYSGEPIAVDPNNSNRVFCGTYRDGLWYSEDGAETWKRVESIPNTSQVVSGGVRIVYFDENSEVKDGKTSVVYAGVYGEGIYKSTDGGMSFSKIPDSPEIPLRFTISEGEVVVSATHRSASKKVKTGLFIYDGETWNNISPSWKDEYKSVGGFMIDRENPNFIVAAGAPYTDNLGYFMRSYDRGKTWENMGFPRGENNIWTNPSCIIQDGRNPNKIILPNGAGIHMVEDVHAANFYSKYMETGGEELVCAKVMSIPDRRAPLYSVACMDRGFSKSNRIDVRPEAQDSEAWMETHAMDFCEENPKFVVRVGNYNGGVAAYSEDYGNTYHAMNWDKKYGCVNVALSPTVKENGYPVMLMSAGDGKKGTLWRSWDFGKTWEQLDADFLQQKSPGQERIILLSDRVDGKTFYYCDDGSFYVSTDCGTTWTKKQQFKYPSRWGENNRYYATIPGIEGGVWIKTIDGIYETYDKGSSWSLISSVKNPVGFGFGKGKSSSNIPAAYVVGEIDGIYGIYISDDLGKNWRRIDGGFNLPCSILQITGDRNVYGRMFIATAGRGVFVGQSDGIDDMPPLITLENKSCTDEKGLSYALENKKFTVKGSVDEPAEVRINSNKVEVSADGEFEYTLDLNYGDNTIYVEAADMHGNKSETVYLKERYFPDYVPVEYTVGEDILTREKTVKITGKTLPEAAVYCGGNVFKADSKGNFEAVYNTEQEKSAVAVYAESKSGSVSETKVFNVTYDSHIPIIEMEEAPKSVEGGFAILKGKLDEPGEVRANGKNIIVRNDLSFYVFCMLEKGDNTIKIQARDTAKNVAKPVTLNIKSEGAASDKSQITAEYKSDKFDFDGDVGEWNLNYTLEKLLADSPNNLVNFGLMWDEENLYIGVKVLDDVIFTENGTSFYEDCIEIYIDGDNNKGKRYDEHDAQLIFVPSENYDDARRKYKILDDGYSMEIVLPWKDFRVSPKAGDSVGFDIDCGDNDNLYTDKRRTGVIGFNGTMNNWASTEDYSTVTLVGPEDKLE